MKRLLPTAIIVVFLTALLRGYAIMLGFGLVHSYSNAVPALSFWASVILSLLVVLGTIKLEIDQ